jgi:hypothetical protein
MVIKCTNIFHYQAIQNLPKGFFGMKMNHLATLLQGAASEDQDRGGGSRTPGGDFTNHRFGRKVFGQIFIREVIKKNRQ